MPVAINTRTYTYTHTSVYYFRVECDDHAVSVRNCAKRSIKHVVVLRPDCGW